MMNGEGGGGNRRTHAQVFHLNSTVHDKHTAIAATAAAAASHLDEIDEEAANGRCNDHKHEDEGHGLHQQLGVRDGQENQNDLHKHVHIHMATTLKHRGVKEEEGLHQ
jgi:hypothetical protein